MVDGYYYSKEFDKAIEHGRRVVDMDPRFSAIYASLVLNYIRASKHAEALQAADTYSKLVEPFDAKMVYAWVYASTGKVEEAHKLLRELEEVYQKEHLSPYTIGLVHFALGEVDEGFEWLEKAHEHHDRGVYAMAIDYELDDLRSDPRYLTLLQRIGLAQHLRQ